MKTLKSILKSLLTSKPTYYTVVSILHGGAGQVNLVYATSESKARRLACRVNGGNVKRIISVVAE